MSRIVRRRAGSLAVVAVLSLGAVACSDDDDATPSTEQEGEQGEGASGTTSPGGTSESDGDTAVLSEPEIGPECDQANTDIAESVVAGATDDAVLNTILEAINLTGLQETLDSGTPYTVFAPTNDAFADLGDPAVSELVSDPGRLDEILRYHVITGEDLDAGELVEGGPVETLNGAELTASVTDGGDVEINDRATVVCGNIEVENGTLHIIDAVLDPSEAEGR